MNDKEEAVQLRAYELWEKDGHPEGKAFEHWLQAEREFDADRPMLEDDHRDGQSSTEAAMPAGTTDQIVEIAGDPVRRGRAGK